MIARHVFGSLICDLGSGYVSSLQTDQFQYVATVRDAATQVVFLEVQKEERTGSDIPISNSIQNLTIVSRFINPLVLLIAIFFPRRRNRRLSAPAIAVDSSAQSCPLQPVGASLMPSNTLPA